MRVWKMTDPNVEPQIAGCSDHSRIRRTRVSDTALRPKTLRKLLSREAPSKSALHAVNSEKSGYLSKLWPLWGPL